MGPEQIQMIVQQASAAFSAVFDFAFSANILVIWGPLFAVFMAINIMRVALGRGYVLGQDHVESYGEMLLRDEIRRGK